MMIREAIDKIEYMALSATKADVLSVGDRKFFSAKQGTPILEPTHPTVTVSTLSGLLDYLTFAKPENPAILVDTPARVVVISSVFGVEKQRETYCKASIEHTPFPFGQWHDIEAFNIAIQSLFVPNKDSARILSITGTVASGDVKTVSDDGVTQGVTLKAGIQRKDNGEVPNPVALRPYRTFSEIDQPESLFVFRMRTGREKPECALFEADGGAWRNVAIQSTYNWLLEQTEIPVIR